MCAYRVFQEQKISRLAFLPLGRCLGVHCKLNYQHLPDLHVLKVVSALFKLQTESWGLCYYIFSCVCPTHTPKYAVNRKLSR